jgi:HEAT repeat protein
MASLPAIRRLRIRELLLLAGLAGLLAYVYVPFPKGHSGDDVGDQLRVLQRGSPGDRRSAAMELARMADKDPARIVPALIQAVGDQDAGVRYSAIGALHVITPDNPMSEKAIGALVPALRDSDPRVRAMAAGILSTFKPPPKAAIAELIAAARLESPAPASATAASGSPAGPGIAEDSIVRSQRHYARASAITALGEIGHDDAEVEQVLVSLAADPVVEVRAAVAQTLGKTGSQRPTAFATEEKLAGDADVFVQEQAITALGSFPKNYVAACPLLYRAYLSKQRPLVDGSRFALGKITKSTSFDAAEARQSKEAPLRFAAAFGLNPDSDEGLALLTSALLDQDPGVRIMAATKLGTASSKKAAALRALQAQSGEKDPGVHESILRSINMLKPPESSN